MVNFYTEKTKSDFLLFKCKEFHNFFQIIKCEIISQYWKDSRLTDLREEQNIKVWIVSFDVPHFVSEGFLFGNIKRL